jgi:AcrR family transcriptional regulator
MVIAERAAERAVRQAHARAEAEVRVFIDAGLEVMRRKGAQRLTVADVLAEAERSTRAFYRHFESKDELLLAIYEHDARASVTELRAQIGAAGSARDALLAWIESTLHLAFDPRRARRTRVLATEAKRLQGEHPEQFTAIATAQLEPLIETLARGRDDGSFPDTEPERDARSVHAIVWSMVEEHLYGDGTTSFDDARAHALRFCFPALGATIE